MGVARGRAGVVVRCRAGLEWAAGSRAASAAGENPESAAHPTAPESCLSAPASAWTCRCPSGPPPRRRCRAGWRRRRRAPREPAPKYLRAGGDWVGGEAGAHSCRAGQGGGATQRPANQRPARQNLTLGGSQLAVTSSKVIEPSRSARGLRGGGGGGGAAPAQQQSARAARAAGPAWLTARLERRRSAGRRRTTSSSARGAGGGLRSGARRCEGGAGRDTAAHRAGQQPSASARKAGSQQRARLTQASPTHHQGGRGAHPRAAGQTGAGGPARSARCRRWWRWRPRGTARPQSAHPCVEDAKCERQLVLMHQAGHRGAAGRRGGRAGASQLSGQPSRAGQRGRTWKTALIRTGAMEAGPGCSAAAATTVAKAARPQKMQMSGVCVWGG